MKKIMYKVFMSTIAAVMVLALTAGCKHDDASDESPQDGTAGIANNADYIYLAETVSLPDDIGDIFNLTFYGDMVYFIAVSYNIDENDPGSSYNLSKLYAMNIDGGNIVELSYKPPVTRSDDNGGQVFILNIDVDDAGNLWVLETWDFYFFNLPPDFNAETDDTWDYAVLSDSGDVVRKLDATGVELLSVDLSKISGFQRSWGVSAFAVSGGLAASTEGIFISQHTTNGNAEVFVIDTDGNLQFKLDVNEYFDRFVKMPGGSIAIPSAVINNLEKSSVLQTIDISKKGFGESISIPGVSGDIYSNSGEYDILFEDGTAIYGYCFGDAEATQLLKWVECNITANSTQNMAMLDDGRILCSNLVWGNADGISSELLVLTKTLKSDLPEKTILTLATVGDMLSHNTFTDTIVEFNKANLFYQINIVDYAEDGYDWDAAFARLSTDIISGNAPDMLHLNLNFMSYADYVRAGLLADIYQFIDTDLELSRDDLVQGAFKPFEIDGGLYILFSQFYINSFAGNASVLGADMGWTIEEFENYLSKLPTTDMPLGPSWTKEGLLRWSLRCNTEDYIDWEAGTVNFDSPEFVKVLELSDRISPYATVDELQNAAASSNISQYDRLLNAYISDFRSIQSSLRETYGLGINGEEITFKGIPTSKSDGHIIEPYYAFGIVEQSPNKAIAWEFLRTFLTEEWQLKESITWMLKTTNLYTNQAAFSHSVSNALEFGYSTSFINGKPEPPPTQTELDQMQKDVELIVNLINSASSNISGPIDNTLLNIILEDAANFFSGMVSAEDAARSIQDRAGKYVSERS